MDFYISILSKAKRYYHDWSLLLGIAMGILTAVISRKTMFHGEAVPFVMELPNYRLPGAKMYSADVG